jgi:septation ring formation regulator EzrA
MEKELADLKLKVAMLESELEAERQSYSALSDLLDQSRDLIRAEKTMREHSDRKLARLKEQLSRMFYDVI